MNQKTKKILEITLLAFLFLTVVFFWGEKAFSFLSAKEQCTEDSNIAVIDIKGEIVPYALPGDDFDGAGKTVTDETSSEDVVAQINTIKTDNHIKALIFNISSYGGNPEASEEIMLAIKRLDKLSVAVVRDGAASGAYLIASATNRIFASEFSDVGSIGITMSYLDVSKKNQNDGIIYHQFASGPYKNLGDPNKPLTDADKALIMRDIEILKEVFVREVAENRKMNISKVEELADGSIMLGATAKDYGLIDEIGDMQSAENWIRDKLKIKPNLCQIKNPQR